MGIVAPSVGCMGKPILRKSFFVKLGTPLTPGDGGDDDDGDGGGTIPANPPPPANVGRDKISRNGNS